MNCVLQQCTSGALEVDIISHIDIALQHRRLFINNIDILITKPGKAKYSFLFINN